MHRLSAYVIVHRSQSNQTADGNRSDGGRNPIGWRTESDWTANANGRGCSCLSCTNKAYRTIHQGGAAVSAAPTKQTEQELHQQSLQNYHFTNRSLIHAQRGIMRHAATSNR